MAGNDGGSPSQGPLIADTAGNLYGVTEAGGSANGGTIYKVAAGGAESVLYAFTGGNDGGNPASSLLQSGGALFGVTEEGGADGVGTVFELTPKNKLSVLHTFTGGNDGCYSSSGLVMDAAFEEGTLFGAAGSCGVNNFGTVFSITK